MTALLTSIRELEAVRLGQRPGDEPAAESNPHPGKWLFQGSGQDYCTRALGAFLITQMERSDSIHPEVFAAAVRVPGGLESLAALIIKILLPMLAMPRGERVDVFDEAVYPARIFGMVLGAIARRKWALSPADLARAAGGATGFTREQVALRLQR